jgi:2-C-methyl-D-erythritol 2,4-cyclodiphosphate synthase
MPPSLLVGHGLDSHRLVPGRRLVLAGVTLDAPRGAAAHSDGDVVLHALSDALLATASLGDIGQHFPDLDPLWLDHDSSFIVERVREMIEAAGVPAVVNVAAVIVLDEPKLADHRAAMTTSLARMLDLPAERVGLTFKTSEGLAPDHVQASVTLLVERAGP